MGDRDELDTVPELNYQGGRGFVIGARNRTNLKGFLEGSFNDISIRYGNGIANGGEGGVTRTYLTFGAPDSVNQNFKGAYSWAFVEHIILNFSRNFTLNGYVIYNQSRGAAITDDFAKTYYGNEVLNKKEEFTIGARGFNYITDNFHLLTEFHYSQRKDGTSPWYRMTKLSIAPTLSVTGERSAWARPHLRFVFSLARYNDAASENLYSPYLEFVGSQKWGHYFGVKAKWWIWK
jgi:maltoporin